MAGEPEIADGPGSGRENVSLSKQFRIDGGRLFITGFFAGPHKTMLSLSICLLLASLVMIGRTTMTGEASHSMIPVAMILAVLSAFCFRLSYVRTMPFELRFDRNAREMIITRPDRPDLVFPGQNISFEIQPRDWFARNREAFWLTVQLPDNRRFFLADTSSREAAEALREHLQQWLFTSS